MKRKTNASVTIPAEWQQRFKASSVKIGFQLHLSRSMLEFLSAVADDVAWDRATFGDIHYPDNWIVTEASLVKRGLIERKDDEQREASGKHNSSEITRISKLDKDWSKCDYRNYCKLTPAGVALVELLKVSGLFVEHDTSRRKYA